MISYKINLIFDEQQALTMMENNETFDSFVEKEFLYLLNKHLEDKGLKGSAGFMNYAHVFNCDDVEY